MSLNPGQCFNPVLGFYCPATTEPWVSSSTIATVSIPFWVSTVLRPSRPSGTPTSSSCFNPVLGFYCPATVLGGVADGLELFQSRSGFLLSCDAVREQRHRPRGCVSIPFWVSTVLRHSRSSR